MINYAAEAASKNVKKEGRLYVVNNTLVNDRDAGVFVRNRQSDPAFLINNIFLGPGVIGEGRAIAKGNLVARDFKFHQRLLNWFTGGSLVFEGLYDHGDNIVAGDAGLVDRESFDYRLSSDSPAIDAGVRPGPAGSYLLVPESEYVHPAGAGPRHNDGSVDIGAHEYSEP
jgi:hypothetical protein